MSRILGSGFMISRILCRRRGAGSGHPSRPAVAGRLQRSTRRLGRAALERLRRPVARPFLTLLRVGFT